MPPPDPAILPARDLAAMPQGFQEVLDEDGFAYLSGTCLLLRSPRSLVLPESAAAQLSSACDHSTGLPPQERFAKSVRIRSLVQRRIENSAN